MTKNARLCEELEARLEHGLSAEDADWQTCFDSLNSNATIYRSADGKSHMSYSGMAIYVTKVERDRDRLQRIVDEQRKLLGRADSELFGGAPDTREDWLNDLAAIDATADAPATP